MWRCNVIVYNSLILKFVIKKYWWESLVTILFHSGTAVEVDAHTFVVDHHVHAAVVAVADGRLAFTVQYLAADVLDVGDTLERL